MAIYRIYYRCSWAGRNNNKLHILHIKNHLLWLWFLRSLPFHSQTKIQILIEFLSNFMARLSFFLAISSELIHYHYHCTHNINFFFSLDCSSREHSTLFLTVWFWYVHRSRSHTLAWIVRTNYIGIKRIDRNVYSRMKIDGSTTEKKNAHTHTIKIEIKSDRKSKNKLWILCFVNRK